MGMVVRTNTMAVNAYRQLSMNQTRLAKSLEKLASGFRVNRAADDASGLAISEKMKAQIVGLEAASANALDGISLVQTAEGALTEVHNMLNRMVYLATKSANGTYQDEVDREAIQAEVNALLDEINRIGDSANFNGIALLNGNLMTSAGGNVTLSKELDNRDILDLGYNRVEAKKAVYTVGVAGGSLGTGLPVGLTTNSTDQEIADYFGISLKDYTITTGAAGTMTITAKVAGVDKNHELITSKALGNVFVSVKGADAYNQYTIAVGEVADLSFIGKTMNVNGRVYTFVDENDWNAAGPNAVTPTRVQNSGDRLADGSYAIFVSQGTSSSIQVAQAIADAISNVEYYSGSNNAWDALTGELKTPLGSAAINTDQRVAWTSDMGSGLLDTVIIDPAIFSKAGLAKTGLGLTLQIGDTADDFNKVSVSVDNMKADGLGLTGLDVSTQEAAGKAINTIRTAINKVSTNRANLGALQNRMEYTINNLDVMAENMMAANSRIRDTDMAKEMMTYTKMSILVQAAQAMLAQANMQPQSILQLLQ